MISDINLHFKRLILILSQMFASRPAKSQRRLKINSEREAQPTNLSNIKVFKILQIVLSSPMVIASLECKKQPPKSLVFWSAFANLMFFIVM